VPDEESVREAVSGVRGLTSNGSVPMSKCWGEFSCTTLGCHNYDPQSKIPYKLDIEARDILTQQSHLPHK
jgi:hypothetical protein